MSNIKATDLWRAGRRKLTALSQSWGFTAYERRALWLFLALILGSSIYRYYQKQNLQHRLDLLPPASQSSLETLVPITDFYPPEKIEINHATSEELQKLPGIGPAKAELIIKLREERGGFKSVDELLDVKGIGPATLTLLKDKATVEN